jgi:outer membrane translocation and assembly module TamA
MIGATMRPMGRLLVIAILAVGCSQPKFAAVPGDTQITVSSVTIDAREGERLAVDFKPLYEYLGLRKKSAIRPGRDFNEFRLAEDRRRIVAFLHDSGHFDAEVDEPKVTHTGKSVAIAWRVHEGVAYRIGSVELVGAPPEHAAMLRTMLPFGAGDAVSLETYRPLRRAMAERLQDSGYGHARGYSRVFADRDAKTVAWFYYIDPGPKTKIGAIVVEGNHQVPADAILARAGLSREHAYSTAEKRRAELALLDTGAFASAVVISDADIQTGPPEWPDTGGALAPEQVDADGNLVPRKLPDNVGVRVVVVEAPRRQLRAELGVEADPTRVDTYAGARVLLRNLLVSQQHVVLEGHVGYGVLIDDDEPAGGVYGSALAQYLIPTTSRLDVRLTGRWRDVLYPDSMLREIVAGPGVRTTLAPGVFADFDAFYRFGRQLDMPMVTGGDELELPTKNDASGAELQASLVADRRNDRIEPTSGWYAGARTSYAPAGEHRWLALAGDLRGFVPLSSAWSIGLRASGAVVVLPGEDGVPLGPRLFGGGAHGMRGYGRDRLSPEACDAMGECAKVGGRSLVETSVELRLLPFRKLYGAALFVDVGGAGAGTNAFDDGVSLATGIGARFRNWYVPIGFDISYGLVREDVVAGDWDRLLVFFRIGEAF